MTFGDWARESAERVRSQPLGLAARDSLLELGYGAFRRLIDSVLGDSVWDREWEVLVVCDAARVDLMRQVAPEYGLNPVDERWSEASCSLDWIERVLRRDRPSDVDVGYVTANPFSGHESTGVMSVDLVENEDIAYLDEVWRDEWRDVGGGVETVPPEPVTDRAIYAWRTQELDRLIVHYMQPHQPFRSRPEWLGETSNLANLMEPGREAGGCLWEQLREGRFDADEFWAAYVDNTRWVLDDVTDRLLTNLPGDPTVGVTADHGNGMGEWGVWAHPPGVPVPAVRKVPWMTTTAEDGGTIEGTAPPTEVEPDHATDRLAALGYVE